MSPQRRSVAQRGRTVQSTVTGEVAANNHHDVRHTFSEFVASGDTIRNYGEDVEESDDDGRYFRHSTPHNVEVWSEPDRSG